MTTQTPATANQQCEGCEGKGWVDDEIDTTKQCIICGGEGFVSPPPKSFAKQESSLREIGLPFAANGDIGRFILIGIVIIGGLWAVTSFFELFKGPLK